MRARGEQRARVLLEAVLAVPLGDRYRLMRGQWRLVCRLNVLGKIGLLAGLQLLN